MEQLPLPPLAVLTPALFDPDGSVLGLWLGEREIRCSLTWTRFLYCSKAQAPCLDLACIQQTKSWSFQGKFQFCGQHLVCLPTRTVLTWTVGSSLESQAEVITVSVLYSRSLSICLLVRVFMRIVIE